VPWPKAHKKETRARIVDAAAVAFRERGIENVSVGDAMDAAGLTHGGFYTHFKSKDELVAEALAHFEAQTRERIGSSSELTTAVNAYLSQEHFAHPGFGCGVAALGPELTRGSARVRRTFAANIQKRLDQLYALTTKALSPQRRQRQASGAFACMAGAMILARGLGPERGPEFLAECRAFLRDALGELPERSAAD
jgi:TetR/AcrR family transcriptional repressor of nem operon